MGGRRSDGEREMWTGWTGEPILVYTSRRREALGHGTSNVSSFRVLRTGTCLVKGQYTDADVVRYYRARCRRTAPLRNDDEGMGQRWRGGGV